MRLSIESLGELLRTPPPRSSERGPRTRVAAVAAVLRNLDEPEILLIKRAQHPLDPWSGHIAFPGGRQDPDDTDSLATAMRETREEVGIDLREHGRHLGPLDDVQANWRSQGIDLVIVPHVFVLEAVVEPRPDPKEVDLAMWAPLRPMLLGEARTTHAHRHEGEELRFPAWQVGPHVVWGLTHRMLESLFGRIRP